LAVAKFFIHEELSVDTVFPVVAQFAEKSIEAAQKLEQPLSPGCRVRSFGGLRSGEYHSVMSCRVPA
jgi:hypothetical protein